MPKLITRKKEEKNEPCNFSEQPLDAMTTLEVPLEELKMRCTRYKEYLEALQPPQQEIMIRASSFTTESVLQMIQQSPQSPFIRIYYGIDETGNHMLFMAPVASAGSTATGSTSDSTTQASPMETSGSDTEEEPIYVDECCACPPLRNCPEDPLLEEQP